MPSNIQSFQSHLTDSFSSKVYLLESLIGNRHWLTSGSFKERDLISFLNDVLPEKLRAKSGFVIFPRAFSPRSGARNLKLDVLNSCDYSLSKQIDILVYNPFEHMPVYEDQDIAILPPEAVSHVIEVKGLLAHKSLTEAVSLLEDYCGKWKAYLKFRMAHHETIELAAPELFVYAWQSKRLSGKHLRVSLCSHLRRVCTPSTCDVHPKIDGVYIYGEAMTVFARIADEGVAPGYASIRGQNVHFSSSEQPEPAGDKTMFSLVRAIARRNNLLSNRFLVDTDETYHQDVLPSAHLGHLKAFTGDDVGAT